MFSSKIVVSHSASHLEYVAEKARNFPVSANYLRFSYIELLGVFGRGISISCWNSFQTDYLRFAISSSYVGPLF